MADPQSLVILISGRGSNLGALIHACETGQINGRISRVISNVPDAGGLSLATSAGIPTRVVDHTLFDSREAFDLALDAAIKQSHADLVVLAGFMRILTDRFVQHWQPRLINIHPSLLPRYPGLNTHQRAIEHGDQYAGASVHYVTPQLDGGPVIVQGCVDIEASDTPATLAQRVLTVEHVIFALALEWICNGRVVCHNDTVVLDGRPVRTPPCIYREQLHPDGIDHG